MVLGLRLCMFKRVLAEVEFMVEFVVFDFDVLVE